MKIRIKGNSIRYRLTKSEVDMFCKTGRLEEVTNFGNSVFTYAIQAKEAIHMLDAQFEANTVTLFLDKEKSKHWFESNEVGFTHSVKKGNGTNLLLLLEKDFACLDEREEDQSDNYPNPNNF